MNSLPHLDRERFDYEIAYMLPWKDDLVSKLSDNGIPVHQIGGPRGRVVAAVQDLRRLVAEREVDLIDAHLPVPGVVARCALRGNAGVRLVYHEHSLSVQRRLSKGRFLGFIANVATYGLTDVIVAVSEDTAADVRRFNRSSAAVKVIVNGIPLPTPSRPSEVTSAMRSLGVPADHRVVGHVAKMVSKKRQKDLVRAAAQVIAVLPNTTFLLIGQGPLRSSLQSMAKGLGLDDRIKFPGYVGDLTSTMCGFDLFALSSLHEGLPTVVIEAASLGIPTVATRVGGTSEIVANGETGILVPPRRPDALATAIVSLLRDDARRRAMGASAREQASRFGIRRRVREIEQVYEAQLSIGHVRDG